MLRRARHTVVTDEQPLRSDDPAADLTAKTFAAALVARRRHRASRGPARAWLYGIAAHKLADWQRRGYAEGRSSTAPRWRVAQR